MKRILQTFACGLALAGMVAGAATIVQTLPFSGAPNFSLPLTFNSFDVSLGTLTAVDIGMTIQINGGNALVDNDGAETANVTVTSGVNGGVSSGGEVAVLPPLTASGTVVQPLTLAPDNGDGTGIDPAPADGASISLAGASGANTITVMPGVISTFTTTASGADYTLNADANNFINIVGSGSVSGGFTGVGAAGSVTVTYTYDPAIIPEPASLAIFGLLGLGMIRRRR